jgi:hypothetical protein
MRLTNPLSDEGFYKILSNEDELGTVIRVHLHIESHINEILNILTPYPKDLKKMNLDYYAKVQLICALGVEKEYEKILSALGAIRNKFAHNLSFTLDKSSVTNLYSNLSKEDKRIVQEKYKKIRQRHTTLPQKFKDLSPREQFELIAITVRRKVLAVIDELNNKSA